MNTTENSYCRFCAEPKRPDKMLNLQTDCVKQGEVMSKITFLNVVFIDVSNQDSLPKTICFVCYDSLNKSYEFWNGVKRAQDVLSTLFTNLNSIKNLSDDEVYDDLLPSDANEDIPDDIIKEDNTENFDKDDKIDVKNVLEVKQEPKEENDSYQTSLNVQELIGAAIADVHFTSDVAIYAKEVAADFNKKVVTNWSDLPWVCMICAVEFVSADSLRTHAKMIHGKCSAFYCVKCKEGQKDDFVSFIKHVRKHWKCLRNYCYYCNTRIDDSSSLKAHLKQHYRKPQMPCPLCGEIHKNEESLKMHIQKYSNKPKRRPRRKPGTPITVEELTCKLCHKVYKNLNSLRDHTKLHRNDRKRDYTCDRCGKMFYNKGTLTSHIMSHDKIRPHECRICNKTFLFPNMLRRHVEVHSGVKPFSCEQCGRCFRLQYQLNAHKIVHTDAMPYICPYCNKAFRFKQILKNHERQHTGAKPYTCSHCGMDFTNWSNYNKHMKRRHGTDTSKKKITPEGVFPINPETGQIMQVVDPAETEEWKSKIMIPGKRGKKKVIKQESDLLRE